MSGNSFTTVKGLVDTVLTDSLNLADAVRETYLSIASPTNFISNTILAVFFVSLTAVVIYLYRYFTLDTGDVRCRCGGYLTMDDTGGTCLKCGKHYGVDGILDLIFRRLR